MLLQSWSSSGSGRSISVRSERHSLLLPFYAVCFDVLFDVFTDNYQIRRCRELANHMHCVRHLTGVGVIKHRVYKALFK